MRIALACIQAYANGGRHPPGGWSGGQRREQPAGGGQGVRHALRGAKLGIEQT